MPIINTTDTALSEAKRAPRTPPPLPAYLRVEAVIRHLQISKATVWRLAAAGKISTLKISKRVTLFSAQSIQDYLDECEKVGGK
ncbi:AlpA family transcriptional regulator [Variovorax sp. dw_308]|uniref:helix-turn-helix transcriptional regulator n=1 Tax=Variovorax sp. dw_308 TaxID=2721546 RepID=UPI001C46F73B|nr:helix-turn-helix domain-containing protein [Variovorax sp. dw_308]